MYHAKLMIKGHPELTPEQTRNPPQGKGWLVLKMFPKRVTLLTMLSFEEWANFAQIKRTPKLFFHIPFLLWESLYNISLILRQTLVGHMHSCAICPLWAFCIVTSSFSGVMAEKRGCTCRKKQGKPEKPSMLTSYLQPRQISQCVHNALKGSAD